MVQTRQQSRSCQHEATATGPSELHLVTGGGGYPGYNLGKKLSEIGHKVRLIDIHEPLWPLTTKMEFIKVDIRNCDELSACLVGVDCVYHMASFGMSGRDQLNSRLIEEVNITGTENVIKACCRNNIRRLVYTSTYNVVFGGQEILNGDESYPDYLPLDKHPDHYSRTKAIAEAMSLQADHSRTANGDVLHTCALRLAGVYGPGEQRHLPRIVSYIERGLFSMTYGPQDSLVDFLHVDNLVQAHILAGEGLSERKNCVAAKQKYYISDSQPINNFVFFRPLVEGLGYKYPRTKLPLKLIYFFALLNEMVHCVIGRIYNFQPILTRTEVNKTGVTHYFKTEKAEKELGYKPTRKNDLDDVVEHFKKTGHMKKVVRQSTFTYYLVNIILSFIFVMIVMSFIPIAK